MSVVQAGQVVEGLGVVGMVRAQGLLPDRQRLAEHRLGAGIVAHGPVQRGQVVEGSGVVGVVRAQGLLPDRQRLAVHRLGAGVVAHGVVQRRPGC